MKLSPVSFNSNNQARNNKIQSQLRLKPMASDLISFGSLNKAGRQEVIGASTEEQRKAVYNGRNVEIAVKKGKIKELLEIPQTDDELFKLLECYVEKGTDNCYKPAGIASGPLKTFLSFQDALMVLEKLHKIGSKKQFLNDRWEYDAVRYNYRGKALRSASAIFGQEASLDDERKLNRILLEIIQDDSTSSEEATELISRYKNCVDIIEGYYLALLKSI